MLLVLNIKYCCEQCGIGSTRSDEFLKINNSAIDAAIDFQIFTTECFKTCPHKQEHTRYRDKES